MTTTEILIVREADVFSRILTERGFSVINFPLLKTEPLADLSALDECLTKIDSFDGIFLTSSKATRVLLNKLDDARQSFAGKFYVLGKTSADLIEKSGGEFFFDENASTAEELLRSIPKAELENKKFLFPCGSRSLRVVPETLKNVAACVREVVVYKSFESETNEKKFREIKEKLVREKVNAICFFSPSGVEIFLKKFENFSQGEIKIAAIGQTTARCIEENNLRVDFTAAKPAAKDFAAELINFLN